MTTTPEMTVTPEMQRLAEEVRCLNGQVVALDTKLMPLAGFREDNCTPAEWAEVRKRREEIEAEITAVEATLLERMDELGAALRAERESVMTTLEMERLADEIRRLSKQLEALATKLKPLRGVREGIARERAETGIASMLEVMLDWIDRERR